MMLCIGLVLGALLGFVTGWLVSWAAEFALPWLNEQQRLVIRPAFTIIGIILGGYVAVDDLIRNRRRESK
jgi:NhaP-type Na+/H+ or K+/H+ antiporter